MLFNNFSFFGTKMINQINFLNQKDLSKIPKKISLYITVFVRAHGKGEFPYPC